MSSGSRALHEAGDAALLAQRAADGFTTATELADTLVRAAGLAFRQAHRVASLVVRNSAADATRVTPDLVAEAASEVLGYPVRLNIDDLRAALDPWAFVERRTIPGGPAPSAIGAHLVAVREHLAVGAAWRQSRQSQIEAAREEGRARLAALLRSG